MHNNQPQPQTHESELKKRSDTTEEESRATNLHKDTENRRASLFTWFCLMNINLEPRFKNKETNEKRQKNEQENTWKRF